MSGIEGSGSIPPDVRATYRQEFAHGLDLFQRSLSEYQSTDAGHKKDMFKQVMDEALQVMNETAKMCLNRAGQKQESALASDYDTFMSNGSSSSLQKLNSDIDQLKKFVG
jgi:hypothetical protein